MPRAAKLAIASKIKGERKVGGAPEPMESNLVSFYTYAAQQQEKQLVHE
jgi:hypothetical protein